MWGGPAQTFYEDEASPASAADYAQLAAAAFAELTRHYDAPDWTEVDVGGGDVKFWTKQIDGFDIPMMRMEGILKASPQEAFDFHENSPVEVKKKWDKLLNQQVILESPLPEVEVMHLMFNSVFPVSKRDTVAFKAIKTLDDGTLAVYGHSINHKSAPITSSYVRAKGKMLNLFRPVPGEPFRTLFGRMVLFDPKGNIPSWLIKMVQKEATKIYDKLNELLVEKYGENRIPPAVPAPAPSPAVAPPPAPQSHPGPSSSADDSGDEFFDAHESDSDFSPSTLALSSPSISSSGLSRDMRLVTPITLNESGSIGGYMEGSSFPTFPHKDTNGHQEDRQAHVLSQSLVKLIAELQKATNILDERLKVVEKKAPSVLAAKPKTGFLASLLSLLFGPSPGLSIRAMVIALGWPLLAIALYHFLYIRRRLFR